MVAHAWSDLEGVRAAVSAGALRRDGELALWTGLLEGRWSLIDHWDAGDQRYLVAIEHGPRALRPREGAVARLAAGGASAKDIARALGVSPSNARGLLASALAKLGMRSRADLYRWSASRGVTHVVATEPAIQVLVLPRREGTVPPGLTASEREVAALAVEGYANRAIADRRATSVRTIANQIAAILRKLGVTSRADIARTFHAD